MCTLTGMTFAHARARRGDFLFAVGIVVVGACTPPSRLTAQNDPATATAQPTSPPPSQGAFTPVPRSPDPLPPPAVTALPPVRKAPPLLRPPRKRPPTAAPPAVAGCGEV